MKKIFSLIVFFALANSAFAGYSIHLNAGTNNIGPNYNSTFPQLVLKGLPNGVRSLSVFNNTTGTLALASTNPAQGVPASGSVDIYVPASSGVVLDNIGIASNLYLRSDSYGASITTGEVFILTF